MKYKKQLLLMAAMVLCTACHARENDLDTDLSASQNTPQTDGTTAFADVQYCEAASSMNDHVILKSLDTTGLLKFEDPLNQTSSIVCSRSGCTHDDAEVCTASLLSGAAFPVLYQDRIYGVGEQYVYSCKADGSDLTTCYTFEREQTGFGIRAVRVGSKLYYLGYWTAQDADEEGYAYTTASQAYLYVTDLTSGATKKLYEFPENYNSSPQEVTFTGTYIIAKVGLQMKSLQDIGISAQEYVNMISGSESEMSLDEVIQLLEQTSCSVCIDPETEEAVVLSDASVPENSSVIGELEDQILAVSDDNTQIWKVDMHTGQSELWDVLEEGYTFDYASASSDGLMLLLQSEDGAEYRIYDSLAGTPVIFTMPQGQNLFIRNESDTYFYGILAGDNAIFDDQDYELFDKQTLYQGES
jgi:hypothetical protein